MSDLEVDVDSPRNSSERSKEPPKPAPSYSSTLIDFVSKARSTRSFYKPEDEYTFVDGLLNPKFVNPTLGMDIPEAWKSWNVKENSRKSSRRYPVSFIPQFKSERIQWGINMKKIANRIVPFNIESVRKQQRDMTPLMHWIRTHEDAFKGNRPQICCNRFILKKLSSCGPNARFSFLAERKDDTVYLREAHAAYENPIGSETKAGAIFESAILTDVVGRIRNECDLNESTYGIYTGKIGDITILFSAEIDGFWNGYDIVMNPNNRKPEDLHGRVAEVKTIHRDLFTPKFSDMLRSKMAECWMQCFLVGVNRVLYGIMNDKKVAQLQLMELEEIQGLLTTALEASMPGEIYDTNFYTQRLHDTLQDVLEAVVEENPKQYVVTTQYDSDEKESYTLTSILNPLGF